MAHILYRIAFVVAVVLTTLPSTASNILDFPNAIFNLEDVPEEADSGLLVIIKGGFSPFVEKRWLAWTDGDTFILEATLAVKGGIEINARSVDPVSYNEFEAALLELGVLELSDPEPAGTDVPYVTDLPTYHIFFKKGADRNSFSVRNPAAAGEEYSRIIDFILSYLGED
jgi:hypothetical protein